MRFYFSIALVVGQYLSFAAAFAKLPVHNHISWRIQSTPSGSEGESDQLSMDTNIPADSPTTQKKEPTFKPVAVRQEPSRLSPSTAMAAMGTSPRRIFLSFLSASSIALAGNFLGVTSKLLTAVPEDVVEASYLDTYFPRGDFKRVRGKGYTFVIPREWVADTFVELAKAQRRTQTLDYSMKRRDSQITLPDSAFGPPGRLNKKGVSESGDTNVSVIVTSGLKDFSLQKNLRSPQEGAEFLIRTSIAPEGSGRVATLVDATEDPARNAYQFEYIVERSTGPPLRNISIVAANPDGTSFYTLTVVAPNKQWEKADFAAKLRKIPQSFHMVL